MAPKIHLVRHAQGLHNVDPSYTRFHDPLLTPRGKQQCAELQKNFPHHQVVDLIVSSPIRRTIYTALLGFKDDIKTKGLQIVALPELQETSDLPCDTGSEPLELANEFAGEPIDFSLVQPDWTNKKLPKWAFNDEAIEKRAQEAREWLLQRPEKEIVVVTHGGLLRFFSNERTSKDKILPAGWANTEFRSYTFDDSRPGAHLIETEDSKRRRTVKPVDHVEFAQLKRTVPQVATNTIDHAITPSHTAQASIPAKEESETTSSKDTRSRV